MSASLDVIRFGLRVLPAALRERAAVRLFMMQRRHAEPPREAEWRSRGRPVEVAGCQCVAFGDDDRPAVLLMHGWEGRGLQLAAYIDPLIAAGHRVLALDGPGHGANKGVGALPTFATFLEQAIKDHAPQIIIAHSLGGAAAIVAAKRSGFTGRVLCIAGPPESLQVFHRARKFMGLPESGLPRFIALLRGTFKGHRVDDVMDVAGAAKEWAPGARLHAVLAAADDDIPVAESRGIVEEGGGSVTVLDGVDHRSAMWKPEAVQAGLAALGIQLVA